MIIKHNTGAREFIIDTLNAACHPLRVEPTTQDEHLRQGDQHDGAGLVDRPPLHAFARALGGVAVTMLATTIIALFRLDFAQRCRDFRDGLLQRRAVRCQR